MQGLQADRVFDPRMLLDRVSLRSQSRARVPSAVSVSIGISRVFAEGRLFSRKVDYASETLNGPSGASDGRFGPCFGRKTAVRATFRTSHGHDRPEIGHLGDHSTFRETNDASKSIRDLPERIIDLPGKVTMVSGSIHDVSQRIKQVPRRIREVPRRLTMPSGTINGLPADQPWCRDT